MSATSIVVESHGVGYLMRISLSTYSDLKSALSDVTIYAHLVVREDSMSLFGFYTALERDMFIALLGVSGVGPGIAINVLSYMRPSEVEAAAVSENKGAFRAVKGVGEKLASQLVLDLKGKFKSSADAKKEDESMPDFYQDAVSALVSMGFTKTASKDAVNRAISENELTLEGVIRHSLKHIK